jgi:hypothetical protein
MNYEDLIDQVVSDAMVATGDVLRAGGMHNCMHNGMRFRGVLKNRKPVGKRALRWTDAENQYYLEHANRVSLREIAVKLGRSTDAIKTHWGRYGMPAPTKFPEFLTANTIGGMLSLDPHKIVGWIDAGMIKGIRLGRVRRVSLIALKMWLVRPTSWVYFRAERIKNSALRSLVLRAQERWGDEWWDSRKVAEYHKCDTRDVCRLCANGQLPGYQAVNVSGRHNDSGAGLEQAGGCVFAGSQE